MGHDSVSRRNFLSLLGRVSALPLMQSPAQILIESIVMGATQTAHAEALGLNPRRFLHILHEAAPPRWMHDLFLTPYGGTVVANKSVGTRYSADGKSVTYSTVNRKGINVPHMWQFDVARSGGGIRPMDELLSNMLCIRGINVANPSHNGAQTAQSVPVGATKSMSALSGDSANAPIPAVASGINEFRYASTENRSAVNLQSSGNMLDTLLAPFVRKDLGSFASKRQMLGSALDAGVKALNMSAESLHGKSALVTNSLNAAKELMSQGFGDLDQIWDDLETKYQTLIRQSMLPATQLVGINDKELISDGSRYYTFNHTPVESGFDLRTIINNRTQCDFMASRFAMAEYVLTRNLSYSVSIATAPLNGLLVNDDPRFRMKFDEHQTGGMPSLISNVYFNMAYSACMLELIDRLKAAGIFSETVIVTGSEFGRSPHADGFGSEHGYLGGNSVIISGALQAAPMVLGNIYVDKKQDVDDSGTWGNGAPITELGAAITMGNWASTVATLLRVPSPVSASASLMVERSGVYSPIIELAKQIA